MKFKKTSVAWLLAAPCALSTLAVHAQAPVSGPVVAQAKSEGLGNVLADGQGKTLYVLLTDSRKAEEKQAAQQACDASCVARFTPLAADKRPFALNVPAGLLDTVKGASGASQATYRGWPLYTFSGDTAAGQLNGQAFQKAAYVITPLGEINRDAPKATATAAAPSAPARPVSPEAMALGQEKYAATCSACHGAAGQGAFGPALAGFARLADDKAFIKQILVGSGDMPGFASLSDKEVAAIATYSRNSWGNSFGAIEPEQVKPLR